MNSTKRIIVYRVGAIGDVVHTLPLVKLLRKNNPDAQIEYVVGSPQLLDLLEQCTDYIDKVWLVTKKTLATEMPKINAQGKVDEFIFLHSGWLKACWLNYRYIRASKLYIYKRDDSLSAVANYVTSYYPALRQELLADPFSVLEWQTLTPISSKAVPIAKPYICIVPGVGSLRPHRAYPLEKWLDLINRQLHYTDNNIILLGGPDEADISQALDRAVQNNKRVLNLIGKTSLVDLVSILSQVKQLYSADTGILHIGAAAGAPTKSVFSITSTKRFGPFSPLAKVTVASGCLCEFSKGQAPIRQRRRVRHQKPSSTNRPKHCKHARNNIARCMELLTIENDS